MSRIGDTLDDAERFFRGSFFGYTWLLILLGAGSTQPEPSAAQILVLVLIGLNYHFFGYVHNDLIDLPVDRTQPLRATDPLVSGRISERAAWAFALAQIPISYALALWVNASAVALLTLSIGYGATVLYNVYGKRCPIPMITDAVQGVAWGGLALFGALLVGEPNPLTLVPVAFGFGFIFLINGVHGGLRDFDNDLSQGRVTTSIYLGASSVGNGQVLPSTALRIFSTIAFLIIVGPGALTFAAGWLPYDGAVLYITLASWLIVNACSAWLLYEVLKTDQPNRLSAIYQHQLPLLTPPIFIMLPVLGWPLKATLLACFFIPLILFVPRVRNFARWLKGAEAYPENPLDYVTSLEQGNKKP